MSSTTPHWAARVAVPAALLAVLVAALLAAWATPAAAHAYLVSADPADGDVLDEAPEEVRLTFNEPVEVPSDGLRVLDDAADAARVEVVDDGDPSTLTGALPDGLSDGGYVISYRVISADGHPVSGVLTFTVGEAAAVDDAVLADIAGATEGGFAHRFGQFLRGASYAAALLAAGSAGIVALVARTRADRMLARRWGFRGAVALVGLAILSIPVQAAAVTGDGLGAAISLDALREVLTSSVGTAVAVRLVGAAVLSMLLAAGAGGGLLIAGAVPTLGSFVLEGHQRTVEPLWLLAGSDAIHLAAAAVWLAGLIIITAALRRPRRDAQSAASTARLVGRFSAVALATVGAVTASGVAMAVPLVGTPDALVQTTYGRLLLVKTAAVLVVVGLAAYNRQRLVPRVLAAAAPTGGADGEADTVDARDRGSDDGDRGDRRVGDDPDGAGVPPTVSPAWHRLATTVRIEAVILLVVALITGSLATTQPASEAAGLGGWYEVTAPLDEELEVDLVVDPNRVGRNTIHIYVLDGTGRPAEQVDDLTLELAYPEQDLGPIPIEPFFAGTGHWIATVDDLTFPGDWEVEVTAGLGRFDEASTTVTVPVAP